MAAFADPRVGEETAGVDYAPELLLDGANTIYLVAPRLEQERLQAIFCALILELIALVEERSAQIGGPIEPRLLLALDECANVAPFPGLDGVPSTGVGLGVALATVFQDIAQIKAGFGEGGPTVLNNHRAKLLGAGLVDEDDG